MAYGTLKADVIQSDTAGVAPQFNDGNGTQVGTLCRAWVNYKGTSTQSIRASFNVSSVTYSSTGTYVVNFSTAMPDTNYILCGTGDDTAANSGVLRQINATKTTTACGINTCLPGASVADAVNVSVAIFR